MVIDPLILLKRWNDLLRSGPSLEEQYELLYQMPVDYLKDCISQIKPVTRREFSTTQHVNKVPVVSILVEYSMDTPEFNDTVIFDDFYWFETLVPIIGDYTFGTKQEGNNGWCMVSDRHEGDWFKGNLKIYADYVFVKDVKPS